MLMWIWLTEKVDGADIYAIAIVFSRNTIVNRSHWKSKYGENTNRGTGIQVSRDINLAKWIISNTQVYYKKRSYIV